MNKYLRKISAVILSLAIVVSFMPMMTLTADAASTSKVQVVTKEKNNYGDNIKYTYNKKGLITKAVSKRSSKDSDADYSRTTTTTYKYNKKNKISRKVTKDVNKKTSYKIDRTTGKKITGTLGTITDTTTSVTTYKYNKKGLVTKSVTTSSLIKEGSTTSTRKSLISEDYDIRQIGSGYYNYNNIPYNGASSAVSTRRETSVYKNNGNGTYTDTSSGSTDKEYYREGVYNDEGELVSYNIVLEEGSGYSYSDTATVKDQTVTTKTYKYDKKKRVKQIKATSVDIDEYTHIDKDSGTVFTEKETDTNTYVEKYTYNKKGRVKKSVVSDPGVKTSTDVTTYKYKDGSTSTETEIISGGKKTRTYTYNGKVTDTKTEAVKNNPSSTTTKYTYDKNGNVKSYRTTGTETYYADVKSEVFNNVSIYRFISGNESEPVETPVNDIIKTKVTKETTVKDGTKLLKTALSMKKSYYGRETSSGYALSGRVVYSTKSKKVKTKLAKDVELQQWMLQNGNLGGKVGLFL